MDAIHRIRFQQPQVFSAKKHSWCFRKIGVYTPKWMVKIMENPIKMDDLGGKPPLFLVQHPVALDSLERTGQSATEPLLIASSRDFQGLGDITSS